MEVLFGVPLHTLPHDSTSWTQRLHPEDSDRVLESIHAAIEGDALHWMDEYRFRRQDGTYAWIRDRGFVIRDAQGQGQRMVGGMTDISAQKQSALQAQRDAGAHAELVRVQQRMSALDLPMEEVLLLAARTAMDLGDGQGAMVVLREGDRLRVRASTGPRAAPLDDTRPMLGYPLWQQLEAEQTVLHSDGSQQHALFATDEGQHGLLSFIAAPLRAGDTVLGMLKVNADPVFTFSQRQVAYVQILAESLGAVLQLRSYAAQLSASELQYRSLFDAHPQPMWVYERGSLRILAVNRAMVRHYGYEEAELLRMTTAQLWPEQERSRQEIEARALPPGVRRDAVHRRHCKKGRHAHRHGGVRGRHHLQWPGRAPGARHRRDAAHAHGTRTGARGHRAAAAGRLQRSPGARHGRNGPAVRGMPHRPGSGRIPQRLGGHGAPLERHRAPEHRTRGLGRPDGGWRGDPASVRYARRALDTPQSRSVGGGIAQRAAGDRPRPAAGAGRRPVGPAAAAARAARGHQSAAARCRTGLRPAHALSGGGAGNRRGGNRAAPAARQRHRLRPRQPAHAPGPAAPAGRGAQGCGCRIGQHRSAVLQATGQPHVRCPSAPRPVAASRGCCRSRAARYRAR